jgi:hypothetical protein
MGVLQLPGYCVEDTREGVFCHATAEQRVCRQSAESVIADLVVGRRCALPYKVEVCVGAERCSVEKDKPGVYAEIRLRDRMVNGMERGMIMEASCKSHLLCRRCWPGCHREARCVVFHLDRLQRRHSAVHVAREGQGVPFSMAQDQCL